jgi:hypothetical protein
MVHAAEMGAADRLRPVLNHLMKGRAAAYRATRGRIGERFPGSPPMLLVDRVTR